MYGSLRPTQQLSLSFYGQGHGQGHGLVQGEVTDIIVMVSVIFMVKDRLPIYIHCQGHGQGHIQGEVTNICARSRSGSWSRRSDPYMVLH